MTLFRQAAIVMALGMSLTFVFLFLVIQAVRLMGWLVGRREAKRAGASSGDDSSRWAAVAAMAAALHERDAQRGSRG